MLPATPNLTLIRAETTLVAPLSIDNDSIIGFDAVSFRAIRTDMNGPFLHSKCNMAAATHDLEVRCSAAGLPKSRPHQG